MADDVRLSSLLLEWQERHEQGQEVSAEELCRDCAEYLPELKRRIGMLRAMEQFLGQSSASTPLLNESAPMKAVPLSVEETASAVSPPPLVETRSNPYVTRGEKDPYATNGTADAPLTSQPAPLDGYEILGELGHGGMGVVYKARHRALKRVVALKMIRGSHASEAELARFRTEAEAVARLQHPNIVQIYEVGERDGQPFFSLEYVDGGSLDKILRKAPLTTGEAARQSEILARAMHAAHQRGIIHRDLKPANVLLTADGTPKITDFGLAKQLDEDSGQTQSGAIMGTPSYMAPEQALGKSEAIGPASDVYALGVILYEMLTGRTPFHGATVMETLGQVYHQEPVPPSRLQPKVPRDLDTICLKCLQKVPARRYASAEALADDLRCFLHGEPILARPVGLWERAVKWTRRRPGAAAALGISCVALVSLVLLGLLLARASYQQTLDRAQLAEKNLSDLQRLDAQRTLAQQSFLAGEEARRTLDWSGARTHLEKALAAIGSEPSLSPLQKQANALLADTNEKLAAADAKLRARAGHDRFKRALDNARFYNARVSTLDWAANVRKTREAAHEALAVFDMVDNAHEAPVFNPSHFDVRERADIRNGCYSVLLILAQATAQPLPGEALPTQVDKALALLDQAGRLRPPTRAYYLHRAHYLALRGDVAGAAAERGLAKATPLDPNGALDHFLLGEECYQRHDLAGALGHLENALRQEPDHFWAQFISALCYLGLNRPVEAKLSLNSCLSLKEDFVWLYLLRGFAYEELGRLAQAAHHRDEAKAQFKLADEDFQKAATLPDKKENEDIVYVLLVNRGVLHFRQDKLAEALADLERAVNLKPNQYEAYVNLAEVFAQQKKLAEALGHLNKAIELRPLEAAPHRARARLYLKKKDLPNALADLDQAVKKEPAGSSRRVVAADHKERGLILAEQKRYQDAAQAFQTALRIAPDYTIVYRMLAETYMELDKYAEALAAWDTYLEAVELSLEAYLQSKEPVADGYRARAIARAKLGQPATALEDFSRALALDPDSATYAARGWVYVVSGATQLALRDFEDAIDWDPANADAYSGKGYCQVLVKDYRGAVDNADEALRRGPQQPRLLYNVARIYAQAAGNSEGGRPSSPLARGAFNRYEEMALALLRQALGLLPTEEARRRFWRDYIRVDAALAPIARGPAFGRLATVYAERAKDGN